MSIINFERKENLSKDDLKYRDALVLLSNKAQEQHYSMHNDTIAKLLLCLHWNKKFDISSLRVLDDQYLKAALSILSFYSYSMKNIESFIEDSVLLSIAENHELTKDNI